MQTIKGSAITVAVLSALLGMLGTACQSIPQPDQRRTEPMSTTTVQTTAIPALDLAAPAHTETATFALG